MILFFCNRACLAQGAVDLKLTVELADGGHSSAPKPACKTGLGKVPLFGGLSSSENRSQQTIGILSRAVKRLEDAPLPSHFDGVAANFLTYLRCSTTWPMKIILCNIWFFAPVLKWVFENDTAGKLATLVRTTTAITIFQSGFKTNVLPKTGWVAVNHRIHPCDDVEDVIDYDTRVINDSRIKITKMRDHTPASPVSDRFHPVYDTFKVRRSQPAPLHPCDLLALGACGSNATRVSLATAAVARAPGCGTLGLWYPGTLVCARARRNRPWLADSTPRWERRDARIPRGAAVC